ncbi:hypothetical protein [Clostridium neonatale]|uniref:hypothetical protein n=1 Tax=Clostridium neonatale TaxID=137838 RepID=UPI00291BAB33|nr:hypothetical protein [Clostridium neonatale]CAI3596685.1 hypothetical protein CNEO4_1460089 [Clostridium neonatale]CAI3608659.1 hypothetical protein CNEO4_1600085 [Clostridium neonatale]
MNETQAIEQLKDLRENQKNFIDDMEDPNNDEFVKDVEALDIAIKALEGTALEVPVQEQLYNQHMKEKKVIKNVCIIMFLLVCVSIYLSFKFIN